jgi:hypothetical protein
LANYCRAGIKSLRGTIWNKEQRAKRARAKKKTEGYGFKETGGGTWKSTVT